MTLDALVRHAVGSGWEQRVVVGIPADDALPDVGGVAPEAIRPLRFGHGALDFDVPGMSDVMPYPSTRFSGMTQRQLDAYRAAWRDHLLATIAGFAPDVIHAHHVWLVAAMLKSLAPDVPVVNQCHATGLRQMTLCPELADEVRSGCARNERFAVLHRGHAADLVRLLGVAEERVRVVGAGYRDELFHARNRRIPQVPRLVYVGKYSASKGLPWLLDAFEKLAPRHPGLEMHVAGSGSGDEAAALQQRLAGMGPRVFVHGMLTQPELARLLRRCTICVLPSFYEGVPLVLVEALACGCRLVATALPGVTTQLAPYLGAALTTVPLLRLTGVDTPDERDLPGFVDGIGAAIDTALAQPAIADPLRELPGALELFTWRAVFRRVERVWDELSAADDHPPVPSVG